jgi:integrase
MLFSKFVTECFEPGVLPTLKFATQEIYSVLLRKHLIPRFGDQRLCDISKVEIQQFVLEKLRDGFAWETANHLRNLMSKVLGTAVSWSYLADNAVRGVKMPERFLKRPHQFLNVDEVRRLIAACKEPVRTIVIVSTMTGLRIGEILALRWKRVDFIREALTVAETCFKGQFGTPKTQASRRDVPMSPAVLGALKALYSRSADRSAEALLFATRHGGPLMSNNLRRGLRSSCKRAGLPRLNWHSLRHTHGTLLHVQGTPLKVAQAQLGHSHMATTLEVYTHASVVAQREAVNLLDEQVFPSVPKSAIKTGSKAEVVSPTK